MVKNELCYYAVNLSKSLKFMYLFVLSDLHYGSPTCDINCFNRDISFIESNPNARVILNGDLIECVTKISKGDIYSQIGTPQEQMEAVYKILKRVQGKIIGCTEGNHEHRIREITGIDLTKDLASKLNVPYDPDGIYLKVSFGAGNEFHDEKQFVYWVYCTHGFGGARTKAAKAVKAERLGTWLHADLYCVSHDHVVNVAPDVYLMPDPRTSCQTDKDGDKTGFNVGRVRAHRKELVKTNSYLKWDGYSRRLGYPPADLITPTIILAGSEKPWPNARVDHKPEIRVIV